MKKAYIHEALTGVLLVGVAEAYLWTQGRTFLLDHAAAKIILFAFYVILSMGSQFALSWNLRIGLKDALKGSLLVAIVVSLGLTLLGFFVHAAVVKDIPAGWTNAAAVFIKFLVTIGMATLMLRTIVASISVRFLEP